MSEAVRFITTNDPVKIYFGPRGTSFRIGVESPDRTKACLLAFETPWLADGAVQFRSIKRQNCHVFCTGNAAADLNAACDEFSKSQGRIPEMAVLPGCAYVVMPGGRGQFEVYIQTDHATIKALDVASETDLRIATREIDLGSVGIIPHWRDGREISVILDVRGEPEVLSVAFSVDLGTSNTCAAVMRGDPPEPKLVKYRGESLDSIPTVVQYHELAESGPRKYVIGEESFDGDQRSFVRMFKRRLDVNESLRGIDVVDQNGVRRTLRVDDVYLDFLSEYIGDFEARNSVLVRQTQATFPPDFLPRALEAMKRAYRRLKVDAQKLLGIDEASAAALYFVFRNLRKVNFDIDVYQAQFRKQHNMLVFDFGGGTTDVSLVSVTVGSNERNGSIRHELRFKVMGAASNLHLGGDNLTLELLKSIRCRVALAAAEYHKGGAALGNFNTEYAAEAMAELHKRGKEFRKLLDSTDHDWPTKKQKLNVLEELAGKVIPTAWKRVGHDEDVFLRERAINTFTGLWGLAERWKKQLCAEKTVPIADADFMYSQSTREVFTNLEFGSASELLEGVSLNLEVDFYQRIRDMVREGLSLCRQVMRKPTGDMHRVDSIRLVGNSCRIPLVKELLLEEFADIPRVEDIVSFDEENAKASVALGACLAAHINEFGAIRHIDIKFEGVDDQLGWEIGEWEGMTKVFETYFHATDRPSERPYVDIEDTGRDRVTLYRRRPGSEGKRPEVLGKFVLTMDPAPNNELEPAPQGKLRIYLIDRVTLRLIRGQSLFKIGWSRRSISPGRDPFSGEH